MSSETQKILIAIEYLDTASVLWVHDLNHFSSMHLAAAAEEIAGKACRINGAKAYFDDLKEEVRSALLAVGIAHTEKQLTEAFYAAKNAIKHMDSRNDAVVNIDARKEAADFILAAYRNFERLGLQDQLSSSVIEVVNANVLLVETDA